MTKTETKLNKLNKVLAQLEVAKEAVEILKGEAKDLVEELDLQGTQQLDGIAIAIVEDSYTKVFNSKEFKKDHADLYEQYKTLEKYTASYFRVLAKDLERCREIAEQ
jgi:hypothetical protein